MFTSVFSLPAHALHQWEVDPDGALVTKRTFHDAGTAIIAFIRIQYDGRLALYWIGDEDVAHAGFDTLVAADADVFVEYHRFAWRHYIRNSVDLCFSHSDLLEHQLVSVQGADQKPGFLALIMPSALDRRFL